MGAEAVSRRVAFVCGIWVDSARIRKPTRFAVMVRVTVCPVKIVVVTPRSNTLKVVLISVKVVGTRLVEYTVVGCSTIEVVAANVLVITEI